MESFVEAWSGVLQHLRKQDNISEAGYNVWISCIEPRGIENGSAVLFVNTNFQRKIINEHYAPKITEALEHVLGIPLGINIVSGEDTDIVGDDIQLTTDSGEGVSAENLYGRVANDYEYSFENFIVGPSNKFAHAASQAVASKPAGHYNPLFIHGGSGLGKTHLLLAICNEINKNNPEFNILYTKGEYITNELIVAIENGTTPEFRAKYRQVDVLLVDDIQFIAGKMSTQEEFFHTFDTLHQSGKQIVLTSDRPPREISTLEDRLRNRFEMGLIADIQPPDIETRIAIIRRKAHLIDLSLPDNVAEYIANQLKNNVRQLEGAVKNIRAQFLLSGENPTLITAQNAIRDIRADIQPVPVTVDRIINEVSRTMNVTPDDIRSSKRMAAISHARQVAVYVVREITGLPMKSIGAEFGTRDHSTIVYALQRVEDRMAKDVSFKGMVLDIVKNIQNF